MGHAIRQVHKLEGAALEAADVKFDVSFLFAGQIKGEKMRLFMVYGAGNFIECSVDTPVSADRRAQIRQAGARPRHQLRRRSLRRAQDRPDLDGLDHAVEPRRRHADRYAGRAARHLRGGVIYRIEPGEPYFHDLRERWSAALRSAHMNIPRPPYGTRADLNLPPVRDAAQIAPSTIASLGTFRDTATSLSQALRLWCDQLDVSPEGAPVWREALTRLGRIPQSAATRVACARPASCRSASSSVWRSICVIVAVRHCRRARRRR